MNGNTYGRAFSAFIREVRGLLKQHCITMIVNVRSHPYSRWGHFNRDKLSRGLREHDEVSTHEQLFVAETEAVLQLIAHEAIGK